MPPLTISIPLPPITALVFEGGGIKGLVYAGALRALKKNNLLKDIKYVAGSSAGAMTALMVALGYTQDEIEQELKIIDFSQFKDHSPSWFGVVGRTINGLRNLFGLKRGYYRGENLYKWVKTIVKKKMGSATATFNDLHQKAIIENSIFKDLFVTATNINQQKPEVFSYKKHGDAPIADVVLASMSIPLFFEIRYMDSNYHIDWYPTQEKIKSGDLVPYIDGGFLDNDPIEIFQEREYWFPGYFELVDGKVINPSALNLRVDSNKEINVVWGKPNNPIIKFFAWLKSLFFSMPLSDNNKLNDYAMMTIPIPDCDISTTKFSLTEDEKERLKQSGESSTLSYIKQKIDGAAYTILKYQTIKELEENYKRIQEEIKLNLLDTDLLDPENREQRSRESLTFLTLVCRAMEQSLKVYVENQILMNKLTDSSNYSENNLTPKELKNFPVLHSKPSNSNNKVSPLIPSEEGSHTLAVHIMNRVLC